MRPTGDRTKWTLAVILPWLLLAHAATPAWAQPAPSLAAETPSADFFESGRLLATGGVNNIEGAGGGGLATWALITGYGTRDAVGANVHGT